MKRNISKIAVSLILISVMMIGASTSAFAVDQTICPESTNPFDPYAVAVPAGTYEPVGAIKVTVNGKEVVWPDATPFIDENNRTMVPLRAVGEAMGLYVDWNNDTRTAFFAKSYKDAGLSRVMSFKIDSNQSEVRVMNTRTSARVAQKIITMDTSAVIVQERTYAPIRFLAESFGFTVGWDNDTRTVIIATDSNYNVSTIDVQTVVTPPSSQGQQPSGNTEGTPPPSDDGGGYRPLTRTGDAPEPDDITWRTFHGILMTPEEAVAYMNTFKLMEDLAQYGHTDCADKFHAWYFEHNGDMSQFDFFTVYGVYPTTYGG